MKKGEIITRSLPRAGNGRRVAHQLDVYREGPHGRGETGVRGSGIHRGQPVRVDRERLQWGLQGLGILIHPRFSRFSGIQELVLVCFVDSTIRRISRAIGPRDTEQRKKSNVVIQTVTKKRFQIR